MADKVFLVLIMPTKYSTTFDAGLLGVNPNTARTNLGDLDRVQ